MKILIVNLILSFALFTSCANKALPNDPIPKHDSLTISSQILKEDRVINIWTPSNYQSTNDSLPVLYMPDGGVKEDFPHIANTLDKLLKAGKIKPVMLVGIENTQRKRDLTGFTNVEEDKKIADEIGKSDNFRAFILTELMPEINKKYRTTSEKGIIGESLAGLFVMETFLLKPSDFDFYIAFDPSLWWNNHNYDKNATKYLQNLPEKNTKVWFATSSAEGMSGAGKNLENSFKKITSSKLTWKYEDKPSEQHNTIFRAAKEEAISWTLKP